MNETIKGFVRDTLGCTCPDEVFNKIVREENVQLTEGCTLSQRISIGDRLLIYVFRINEPPHATTDLAMLVNCGEQERNREGFSRFRLVLLCERPDDVTEDLNASFASLQKDDRIHLHIHHLAVMRTINRGT